MFSSQSAAPMDPKNIQGGELASSSGRNLSTNKMRGKNEFMERNIMADMRNKSLRILATSDSF